MRRHVAICNFNLADYARWEGQEGVGLQGGNATGLDQKNGSSVYSLPPFFRATMLRVVVQTILCAKAFGVVAAPLELFLPQDLERLPGRLF